MKNNDNPVARKARLNYQFFDGQISGTVTIGLGVISNITRIHLLLKVENTLMLLTKIYLALCLFKDKRQFDSLAGRDVEINKLIISDMLKTK